MMHFTVRNILAVAVVAASLVFMGQSITKIEHSAQQNTPSIEEVYAAYID